MPMTTAGRNVALDGLSAQMGFSALHDGFPGDTGANEITGGSYARLPRTWAAAAGGVKNSTDAPEFLVPAGKTVLWSSEWDNDNNPTPGTCLNYAPAGGNPFLFLVDTVGDTVELAGHPYNNDDQVVFYGDTPPGGLVEGDLYYVVSAAADNFQVSLTQGGGAVPLTSQGGSECRVSLIVPETFGADGTYKISLTSVDINFGN